MSRRAKSKKNKRKTKMGGVREARKEELNRLDQKERSDSDEGASENDAVDYSYSDSTCLARSRKDVQVDLGVSGVLPLLLY